MKREITTTEKILDSATYTLFTNVQYARLHFNEVSWVSMFVNAITIENDDETTAICGYRFSERVIGVGARTLVRHSKLIDCTDPRWQRPPFSFVKLVSGDIELEFNHRDYKQSVDITYTNEASELHRLMESKRLHYGEISL